MSTLYCAQPILPIFSAPKAILFDWDDTLIQTWPLLYDIYKRVSIIYDILLPEPHLMHEISVRHGRDYFEMCMGAQKGASALCDFLKIYKVEFRENLTPMPGAHHFLESLSIQGIPMGIVSNKEQNTLLEEVHHLGWEKYFKCITGTDPLPAKPSPTSLFHTLESMNFTPSKDIWFVGDSIVDHETAEAAGCLSVHMENAHAQPHGKAQISVTNWNQFGVFLSKIFSSSP